MEHCLVASIFKMSNGDRKESKQTFRKKTCWGDQDGTKHVIQYHYWIHCKEVYITVTRKWWLWLSSVADWTHTGRELSSDDGLWRWFRWTLHSRTSFEFPIYDTSMVFAVLNYSIIELDSFLLYQLPHIPRSSYFELNQLSSPQDPHQLLWWWRTYLECLKWTVFLGEELDVVGQKLTWVMHFGVGDPPPPHDS